MVLRALILVFVATLAACSLPPPPDTTRAVVGPVAQALAPFEDAALIPPEVAALPWRDGAAYVVLVQLPAPGLVTIADPNRARLGLLSFLNPLAVAQAGTALGHAMVGWRCADGSLGLTSKTGDVSGQGYALLRQGWGLGAVLATYDDGHLIELADLPARHRRALRSGRARIVALEIDEGACQRLRRSLAEYVRSDPEVFRTYTMLPTTARPQGDACGGFALWLAGLGGAIGPLPSLMMRDVTLRDSFMGLGTRLPPGVTPHPTSARAPVPLGRLIVGDWTQGARVAEVTLLDMELLLLTLDVAQRRAGLSPARRLPPDDALAARLETATEHWLARWRRATPVRIGAAPAVVLHRR